MQSLSNSINNIQRNTEEEENLIMPLDAKIHDENANIKAKSFEDSDKTQIENSIEKVVVLKKVSRRWLVLLTFSSVSLMSAFNWIEYNIIQDVTVAFYNESLPEGTFKQNEAVNWMSMVYMLCYIPLVFPSMFLLDMKGLKVCVAMGALLTCIGAWIKVAAVAPNRFAIAMLGQTLCAIAQSFTLGVPARLSSLWFGPSEISTATSIGVFGNQLGTALGFLIPPTIIPNTSHEVMTTRFYYLLIPVAVICTILFILSLIVIKDKPSTPPNFAQAQENLKKQSSIGIKSFLQSLKNLFTNRNYILILISYGINTGCYYSISTLLNQLILPSYQNENEKIGYIGLILVLSGLLGALLGGFILDRTKAFKLTTLLMYIMCLVAMVLFTFTIKITIWIIFGTAFLLGFFMTGYLPVGFEFAAELTYPESEGTSSGLLNTSAQIFGIAFIYSQGKILDVYGVFYANIFICIALSFGFILTLFITSDYRRQNAFKKNDTKNSSITNTTSNVLTKKSQSDNNNLII